MDRLDEDCTYRNYEVGLKLGHSWIVGPNLISGATWYELNAGLCLWALWLFLALCIKIKKNNCKERGINSLYDPYFKRAASILRLGRAISPGRNFEMNRSKRHLLAGNGSGVDSKDEKSQDLVSAVHVLANSCLYKAKHYKK